MRKSDSGFAGKAAGSVMILVVIEYIAAPFFMCDHIIELIEISGIKSV